MRAQARAWTRIATNRWLLGAVVVAVVLRLAWVVWATQTPAPTTSDPAEYLRLAVGFADGRMPTIGARASAFWPPGWPLALAPLAWLSLRTGWLSVAFAAALLNVVAGTASVVGAAALASRWIGPAARNPTAWLLAIAPGPIYLTSTALTETWFTALVVLILLAATRTTAGAASTKAMAVLGLAIGYAILVRSPGLLLLAAPALTLRATAGSWRGAGRPTVAVVLGALVVLAPWVVRNGVQVGVWTPTSTNNAAFLCIGNRPGATGVQVNDAVEGSRCYRGSPFDDPDLYGPGQVPAGATFSRPDESEWYGRTIADAIGWGITNPARQPGLILRKTYETFASDASTFEAAEDFGRLPLVGASTRGVFQRVADLWYGGVLALAALGLAFVGSCRRAVPLWGTCVLTLPTVWAGIGLARYHQPLLPLIAIFAGAAIATVRAAEASG